MVYGISYMVHKHKDPATLFSGIPPVLALRARMEDPDVHVSVVFGAPIKLQSDDARATQTGLCNHHVDIRHFT